MGGDAGHPTNGVLRCSIIGSFRKYYAEVLLVIDLFHSVGVEVLSPKRSTILNPDDWFVRFQIDDPAHRPPEIQLIALHRILRSDFVYVLAPGGYVGRTTCYEIGRIHERDIPLYFSEFPIDLPIAVAASAVLPPDQLAAHIKDHLIPPAILVNDLPASIQGLANRLRAGDYVE